MFVFITTMQKMKNLGFVPFFKVKVKLSGLNLIGKKKEKRKKKTKDCANLQYRHETKPNPSLHLCLFLI